MLADRGYYKGTEILEAEKAGLQTYTPKPMTSGAGAEGRFSKADFVYDAKADEYRSPAGQILRRGADQVDSEGMVLRSYARYGCSDCPMKAQCTPASFRWIRRWEHEDGLDIMQQRLERNPNAMKIRRRTVEHVVGTLKHWLGSTHFLMKTLKHVPTEVSLHVLAYNLKRLMGILGNSGAACMTGSKTSSGRTRAPCRRRRNFSTRWGSGVIGAIAIQAANGSNQIHGKRSIQLSMAVHSTVGSGHVNRLLVGQVAFRNSWMFLRGGHRD